MRLLTENGWSNLPPINEPIDLAESTMDEVIPHHQAMIDHHIGEQAHHEAMHKHWNAKADAADAKYGKNALLSPSNQHRAIASHHGAQAFYHKQEKNNHETAIAKWQKVKSSH
jgi:hypothetical protein